MMSNRWDQEYHQHHAEQRELDRLKHGKRNPMPKKPIEDYEPEQHLHWPEAKTIQADE